MSLRAVSVKVKECAWPGRGQPGSEPRVPASSHLPAGSALSVRCTAAVSMSLSSGSALQCLLFEVLYMNVRLCTPNSKHVRSYSSSKIRPQGFSLPCLVSQLGKKPGRQVC